MASEVFFTTNPSEFGRLESVYVVERDPPGFIRGRNLSTVALAGKTIRGPTTPQTITSLARFLEVYGGRDQGTSSGLPVQNQIWLALQNKPFGTIVCRRVVGESGSVAASLDLDTQVDGLGTDVLRITAKRAGLAGNTVQIQILDATSADANEFNLSVQDEDGDSVLYENLNITTGNDNLATVIGESVLNPISATKLADGRPVNTAAITVTEVVTARATPPSGFIPLGNTFGGNYVATAGAGLATAETTLNAVLRVQASSQGVWGNNVAVVVENPSDGVVGKFNLRVQYQGDETLYENLDIRTSTDNLLATVGDDIGNLVVLTKVADGTPTISSSAVALAGGSDGTFGAADYIQGVADLTATQGPAVVMVPESLELEVGLGAQATFNATLPTRAAEAFDRVFVTWSGIAGNPVSAEVSAITAQLATRSDRIIWCYNGAETIDPETGTRVTTGPHTWMASILSQNNVDIHPGSRQTAAQTAGIVALANEALSRNDLIALREAGISQLERLPDAVLFRSGVTTSLTTGRTEITRRRSTDFLQLSASDRLRFFVKAKNTAERRAQIASELTAFSQGLRDLGFIIAEFALVQDSVNTAAQRAQGIEKVLWRVRLIGHILALVLETEIGTGVTLEQSA